MKTKLLNKNQKREKKKKELPDMKLTSLLFYNHAHMSCMFLYIKHKFIKHRAEFFCERQVPIVCVLITYVLHSHHPREPNSNPSQESIVTLSIHLRSTMQVEGVHLVLL